MFIYNYIKRPVYNILISIEYYFASDAPIIKPVLGKVGKKHIKWANSIIDEYN